MHQGVPSVSLYISRQGKQTNKKDNQNKELLFNSMVETVQV